MRVIDSHTEGEPTRLVVSGGPDLGLGALAARRQRFTAEHDGVRTFVLNEPRGFEAIVGALLCEPAEPGCAAGLIFFNNAGTLGMCGHGTIGAAVTLAHMGRLLPGRHRFDTPVGVVGVELHDRNTATIANVPSYLHGSAVTVPVEGLGTVTGDVAWGGNWFFLTEDTPHAILAKNIPGLTDVAQRIKQALVRHGVTGRDGGEIDHIELFGPGAAGADSCSFVLCPGGAYDRSPCGTGTSAKLACLAAHGGLAPDTPWVQESVIGTRFTARYAPGPDGTVLPSITGRAWVSAEATLLRDPTDPFPNGIGGVP
ncbi:proline racemase family protein [Lichenihabitans sp. Uapishka_5]|uniref:4-hydroxyproline epimerase n=1 Tax=Lichenihabitans sp. Uapishka_5 TaxID=3037302 RepID=UPI0029E7EF5C|nr:proline racemase family protein [Lichenihabitans sp. Uapishka_5]MDX7951666.1 proline racemase family protein [Lichenihabitans sp. Uapishka_5]